MYQVTKVIMHFLKTKNENQRRLAALLDKIEQENQPSGWKKNTMIAVGGLTEIGFSKLTNHLLVISSSGRSVIDCANGQKLARDYEEYGDWYNPLDLTCQGIGPIGDETITIAGLCGGGLPHDNQYGESLQLAAPQWPVEDIYFCPPGKSILIERFQTGCCHIFSDHIRSYGFSWNGEFIVAATSSDLTIWQRLS